MITFDLCLGILCTAQPMLLLIIIFIIKKSGIWRVNWFGRFRNSRREVFDVKFYECASTPKNLLTLGYDISTLTFCAMFLIYDLDLIFFLTELVL